MGIIRAAVNAVHGSLADQWLETVEPYEMGEHTVFTEGILVRKGQNKKGSQTISNGSVIHVYDNQFMMLVDGGKIPLPAAPLQMLLFSRKKITERPQTFRYAEMYNNF